MDDELTLVRRAAAGDDTAFETIMKRYEKLVFTVALRSVSNRSDAECVSQEAFYKAWRSLKSFRGECSLGSWLCRITNSCAIDYLRTVRRHEAVSLTVEDEDGETHEMEIPDTEISRMPEENAIREEQIRAVREAIAALPEDQKKIVTMRDMNGMSYQEISDALTLEMGTVKSRLNRARAAVKKYLTERHLFP